MAQRFIKFFGALIAFVVTQTLTIFLITLMHLAPRGPLMSYVPFALLIGTAAILPFVVWEKPLRLRLALMPIIALVAYLALVGPRLSFYLSTADSTFALMLHTVQWLCAAVVAAIALDLEFKPKPKPNPQRRSLR